MVTTLRQHTVVEMWVPKGFYCSEANLFTQVTVAGDCSEETQVSTTSGVALWVGVENGPLMVGQWQAKLQLIKEECSYISLLLSNRQSCDAGKVCSCLCLSELTLHMGNAAASLSQATNYVYSVMTITCVIMA